MSRDISSLRRIENPETSADPRVRRLVDELAQLPYAPAPRPEFRAELRAQLVAITERVVAEGDTVPDTASGALSGPATDTTLDTTPSRRREKHAFRRPLGLAAACVAVLAIGFGGAVWKSQSALPGDSLYGLKRASEDVRLSITSGDTDRGHEYLSLATTRVDEARALLHQDDALASGSGVLASGVSQRTMQLIQSTLRAANDDVTSGSSLLGTEAVQSHSAAPLQIMTSWAPTQLTNLRELATAIGAGPAWASTMQSQTLVRSALGRARTLGPQVAGGGCRAARTDDLGPVACTHSVAVTPTQRVTHHPSSSTSTRATSPKATTSTPRPSHHHATPNPPATGGSTAQGPTATRTSGPSLPTNLPTQLPISISSCGVSASIGSLSLHLGACSTHS